jgi:hydroxymethylglutaryl-CoA reductase
MWRSKKFLVIALSVAVLVVGSIGGIALAQTEGSDGSQTGGIYERAAAILADDGVSVTAEQLKEAFTQAKGDMRSEALAKRPEALAKRLQAMVDAGKITQEEADEYRQWLESKPDGSFGFKSRGGFRGMRKMHGSKAPSLTTE